MFSFTGMVSAASLSHFIVETAAPSLAMKSQYDQSSYNNAILQAVYGTPVLVIGMILAIRNRRS